MTHDPTIRALWSMGVPADEIAMRLRVEFSHVVNVVEPLLEPRDVRAYVFASVERWDG